MPVPGLTRGPVLSPLTPPMPPPAVAAVQQMQQTRNRNNRNCFSNPPLSIHFN